MNGLALCAGIGGLELGLTAALAGRYRTVCYVEREAYAAACLVARMEDAALDTAPVWDDISTFDGRPWRGVVDVVAAGYPCQPHSVAGKRKGAADERNLWPAVARIISECAPALVFLENVPGAMRFTYEHVLPDLSRLGYRVEAGLFSAEEVGAPHRRRRLFVLAHASGSELAGWQGERDHDEQEREAAARDGRLWPPGPDCPPGEWPADVPQPAVCRGADGAARGLDRLRALGNAVVPQTAALAFRALTERL